jgi:hypothetical protein
VDKQEPPVNVRAWFTIDEINAWADKKLKENPQWSAQPDQEPVAWADMAVRGEDKGLSWTPGHFHKTPLYAAPPKREWVGLTGDEARKFYEKYTDREELIYAIDKFLEEKNT